MIRKFEIGDRVTFRNPTRYGVKADQELGSVQLVAPMYRGSLSTQPVYRDLAVVTVLWDNDFTCSHFSVDLVRLNDIVKPSKGDI